MDKVGKLDEIDHPEIVVYSSFYEGIHLEIGLGTIRIFLLGSRDLRRKVGISKVF
jgi:hypothetical protein